MMDRHIRVSWVAIYIGWVATFGVWGASWYIDSTHLGQLSILLVAVDAVVTIREFFVEHDRAVKNIITVLQLGDPGSDGSRLRPMKPLK